MIYLEINSIVPVLFSSRIEMYEKSCSGPTLKEFCNRLQVAEPAKSLIFTPPCNLYQF